MSRSVDIRLYGVLDPTRCKARDPIELTKCAARGGITLLQLRDKLSSTRDQIALARELGEVLKPHAIPLIVNDRIDVALAAGAAGVHVGRTDMLVEDARRLLGAEAILGATVHHLYELDELPTQSIDYFGLGPVFATQSKDPGDPPFGPKGLSSLIRGLRCVVGKQPCCGIAGIKSANAASVIDVGADGVAIISDIFMANDVEASTRRLRQIVDQALNERATT